MPAARSRSVKSSAQSVAMTVTSETVTCVASLVSLVHGAVWWPLPPHQRGYGHVCNTRQLGSVRIAASKTLHKMLQSHQSCARAAAGIATPCKSWL